MEATKNDYRRESYILGGWNVADFDDDVPHPPGEGVPVGGGQADPPDQDCAAE